MSGSRAPHLKRRNGIYHLRVRVPDRLRDRVGRQEISKSLQTYSPALARRLAASVSDKVMETFAMLDEFTNISPDQARELIQACFAQIRREIDARSAFLPRTDQPEAELEEQAYLTSEEIGRLTLEIETSTFSDITTRAAQELLAAQGVHLGQISEPSQRMLLNGMARALIEQQRFGLARLHDPLAIYQPHDALFDRPASTEGGEAYDGEAFGLTLGKAIDTYLSAKKPQWVKKTFTARIVHLGYLSDFLSASTQLAAITPNDVRRFRKALTMLRANHGRQVHLSFRERLTENVAAQLKNKTASLMFEPVKAFFRWAHEEEGLIEANPAAKIRWQPTQAVKSAAKRRPFGEDELVMLFGSPLFVGSRSKHRRFDPGETVIQDAKYWIPIIGYYTGMRLGEIVQLHVSDVAVDEKLSYFDLNENSGSGDPKHIKTAAGVRQVLT